jgi:DNA repair protein RecO (recombination protein O)
VLRRWDAGESDRRLTLLTAELGVIEATAKGARKSASRLAGVSEPLTVSVLGLATTRKVRYVTQAQPVSSFPGLRMDIARLSLGLALCELASALLPRDEPAPEAFRLLVESLSYLEAHDKPIVAAVWSEIRLLGEAGFAPEFGRCVVCGVGLKEGQPFVSPQAGGYLCEKDAPASSDRFRSRAEVLIGLSRLPELSEPPQHLKLAEACLRTLYAFARHFAERALPANEQALSLALGPNAP